MNRIVVRVLAAITLVLVSSNALAGDPRAADPPASQPSKLAAERAEKLKADVKRFTLILNYTDPQDKPFYRLLLSVPVLPGNDRANPFFQSARITEDQAKAIIDYLAADCFFDKAEDGRNRDATPKPPTGPTYLLAVTTDAAAYQAWIGWNLKMLHRLDGLRKLLDGDAAKGMDLLLGRLSGYRRQWEPAASQPDGKSP